MRVKHFVNKMNGVNMPLFGGLRTVGRLTSHLNSYRHDSIVFEKNRGNILLRITRSRAGKAKKNNQECKTTI